MTPREATPGLAKGVWIVSTIGLLGLALSLVLLLSESSGPLGRIAELVFGR